MNCDQCQGPTKDKWIKSKKDGKSYKLLECTSGCTNGKYAYSFFPPKDVAPTVSVARPAQAKPNGDAVAVLKSIETTLKNILQILQAKSGQIPMQPEELTPDQEVPF